jgi:large conductance mechanosensitive channel
MGLIKEFKEFAMKGSVVDLAIGVVIGAAFSKIVDSLIVDVITPIILNPAMQAAHLTKLEDLKAFGTVKYGVFLSSVINFLIVAFTLFLVIKAINKTKAKEEAKAPVSLPPPIPNDEQLLMEIRDLLKKK